MGRRNRIYLSLTTLCILLGAFFLILFWSENAEIRQEYAEAQAQYSNLQKVAGISTDTITIEYTDESIAEGINFDALSAINPDVVGWITVPNTNISYPIVQSMDNLHYLHHTFQGTRNASGAVFLDYRDLPDFQGIARIYAHNMKDGSMFATLINWHGELFTIHTSNEVLIFNVTFRGVVATNNSVFSVNHTGEEIILVTCVNGRPNQRFIIRAELRNPLRDTLSQRQAMSTDEHK